MYGVMLVVVDYFVYGLVWVIGGVFFVVFFGIE